MEGCMYDNMNVMNECRLNAPTSYCTIYYEKPNKQF
jgi:hypothetical protein